MQTSIAQQVIEETINQVALENNIDPRIVEAVIRHQFSFVTKSMLDYKNIRLYRFGVFKIKEKYRNMINDFGYIYKFKGPYAREKSQLLAGKVVEYLQRVEKPDMERQKGRRVGKKKS